MITRSFRSVQFVILVVLKKVNLKMHIVTVLYIKKSCKCSICNFSFSQKVSLKISNQFIRKKVILLLNVCYRECELKKHSESVHDNLNSHKCSICDYSCSRKGTLKIHIESHSHF